MPGSSIRTPRRHRWSPPRFSPPPRYNRSPPTGYCAAQVWNGELKHAMLSDQTKSRRIQAELGKGLGRPTGFDIGRVMPSVPSFFIDEPAWQLIQEATSWRHASRVRTVRSISAFSVTTWSPRPESSRQLILAYRWSCAGGPARAGAV